MESGKAIRRGLPMRSFAQAAEVLKVLAHPVRLKLVELLSCHQLTVGQLSRRLGLPPNQVSQHLNQMRARGILARRREGRCVYYEVTHPHAQNLLRCIQRYEQTHLTYQDGEAI